MTVRHRAAYALRHVLIAASIALSACASAPPLVDESGQTLVGVDGVYTLTNLHPDSPKPYLYSINYQRADLLPVCTPVRLVQPADDRVTVVDLKTGREYLFIQHKASQERFDEIIRMYFGRKCPDLDAMQLTEVEREGIRKGEALPGMRRQAVILAIGYPPRHRTPSLDSDRWIYWQSKFVTDTVLFENGVVVDGTR